MATTEELDHRATVNRPGPCRVGEPPSGTPTTALLVDRWSVRRRESILASRGRTWLAGFGAGEGQTR